MIKYIRNKVLFYTGLLLAAIVALGVGLVVNAAAAHADAQPVTITGEHPGVVSASIQDGWWRIDIVADMASEIKVITPDNFVVCSETDEGAPKNGNLSCDGLAYTFQDSADCVTVQFDWHYIESIGFNSSDPEFCRTPVEPTETPTPTPTDTYTSPVLDCPTGTVPGWLNDHGDPTSCVNNTPATPNCAPGTHFEVGAADGGCVINIAMCALGSHAVNVDGNDGPDGIFDHCELNAAVAPPTDGPTPPATDQPIAPTDPESTPVTTTPQVDQLANTGQNGFNAVWIGVLAGIILAAGVELMVANRKAKK